MNGDSLASSWYYSKAGAPGGQQVGPVSWEQLLSLAQTGALTSADLVWNPQMPQWVLASQIPGLLPVVPFAGRPGAYPAGGRPGGQWQAPRAAYNQQPYWGQSPGPKKSRSWLAWAIPLIALVLAGIGLTLYFVLRDDGGSGGSTDSTKRTTTTAEVTTTTDEVITTVTQQSTTTTMALGSSVWTDLNPGGAVPVARTDQAMVYDPVGQRTLLFGGWSIAEIYNDTWSYDAFANSWTALNPAGDLPAARAGHAMAYDPKMGVVILFGGWDSLGEIELDDTWAYDPAANTWIELSPAGDLPAPRENHSLVYDPYTGAMIMFGGFDENGRFRDTWAYSVATNTWTNLSPASDVPSGRDRHSMVYDPTTGKMILFGGWDGDFELDDTWAYDPLTNTWEELTSGSDAPSPRSGHRAVYDSTSGQILLFGGWNGESELNDTWVYDPAANTWTDVSPAGATPEPRDGHSMAYDEALGKIIVFGGMDDPGDRDFGDTWAFSFGS